MAKIKYTIKTCSKLPHDIGHEGKKYVMIEIRHSGKKYIQWDRVECEKDNRVVAKKLYERLIKRFPEIITPSAFILINHK